MLDTLIAMDALTLLSFMAAGILLNFTPGADVIFATACGISGGPRVGIAAALGITLGSVMHLSLAVLGLSAALIAIPHAYDVIRYAGATYLLWLGWRSWRDDPFVATQSGTQNLRNALRRGFITNALNPKVALFILALLPQFTDPDAGPIWQQMIILGLIFMATGMLITSAYGAAAGLLSRKLRQVSGTLSKISAIIFAGLAARLVFD